MRVNDTPLLKVSRCNGGNIHKCELTRFLLVLASLTSPSEQKAARVPHPKISARVNNSTAFSCESHGEPLASCIWSRKVNGQREATIVDDTASEADGLTEADRVSYFGHELENGKCSVRIGSMKKAHLGIWSCILIAKNGEIFTGQVEINEGKWSYRYPNASFQSECEIHQLQEYGMISGLQQKKNMD